MSLKSIITFSTIVSISILLAQTTLRAADPISGIGPVGEVIKLHGNLKFTEGPAADAHGNIYFTDIPANRIYQVNKSGKLSIFLEPSGHCNGLMFDNSGTLLACSMDGQLISIDVDSKKVTPLSKGYNDTRYNAPNDLVVDRSGGIYFTDPRFRAPQPWPQEKEAFYYRSSKGKVTRLGSDLPAPNGVILSPDEKTLYVIPSMQKEMMSYAVISPGKLGPGKVFCRLAQKSDNGNGGGDGLTVDTKGNLYITSGLGLQVFDSSGKALGIIEFPEQPANVAFGGEDLKTLFVTARTSLYSVKMSAKGHIFPGSKQ